MITGFLWTFQRSSIGGISSVTPVDFCTMSSYCLSSVRKVLVVSLGLGFFICGVHLYLNWIELFTNLRGKEMALSPISPSYSAWKVPPLPLNFDVYLFNWTNPQDFRNHSIKPRFEELGPYRFRENSDKVDIVWHPHNYSVSFRKKSYFYFDADGSKGNLDDRITSLNIVAYSAGLRALNWGYLSKKALEAALLVSGEELSVTKTADEFMFTGYFDQFVTIGSTLSVFTKDIVVPFERMGWFTTRNGSTSFDEDYNMFTGADDIRKIGQISTSNYKTNNGFFDGECGDVKGSLGEFFPPNLTPNDSIALYTSNMCRSIPLDFTETVEIHGVKGYKFSGGERSVDNGTLYPETKCFCVQGKCERSGVINLAPCKYNASIFLSYPHFYKADPYYLNAIDGLNPIKEKHEFFMTLEPNAGVPLDTGGGFQANILVDSIPGIIPYDNIPRTFIPIMWCEQRVRVTPEIAREIALVPLIILWGQIVTGILLAAGFILIFWYPTKYIMRLFYELTYKENAKLKSTQATSTQSKSSMESLPEFKNLLIKHNVVGIIPNSSLLCDTQIPPDIITTSKK